MKYFFSTIATLFTVLILTSPAWAAEMGGKDHGVQAKISLFANQFSQNNGSATATSTETDAQGDLGYGFGTLYVGATYFNSSLATTTAVNGGATSTSTSFVNWYGPSVGVLLNNFRILGTYIAVSTANQSGVSLSNGTGFGGTISYDFYVSPKVFISPLVDYYTVTYTSSTPALGKNFTVTHLAPFLGVGIDF